MAYAKTAVERVPSSARHRPGKNLYTSRPTNWLVSRFHFSFAEWFEPKRTGFGQLRVVNDDLVNPREGFGTHPHGDMEIFSYVLHGGLTHKDSMGSAETLGRGSIQYMSAGTGVWHSEYNNSPSEDLRFLQIWVKPNRRGLSPNYGSTVYNKEERHNQLLRIITDNSNLKDAKRNNPHMIGIYQDVNVYVSELDSAKVLDYELKEGRQAYLVNAEGKLKISEKEGKFEIVDMEARDAVELVGPLSITFEGVKDTVERERTVMVDGAHFLMIEMAQG
eukprot:Clim_evm96s172 gene=Clim_evmTU96s172